MNKVFFFVSLVTMNYLFFSVKETPSNRSPVNYFISSNGLLSCANYRSDIILDILIHLLKDCTLFRFNALNAFSTCTKKNI